MGQISSSDWSAFLSSNDFGNSLCSVCVCVVFLTVSWTLRLMRRVEGRLECVTRLAGPASQPVRLDNGWDPQNLLKHFNKWPRWKFLLRAPIFASLLREKQEKRGETIVGQRELKRDKGTWFMLVPFWSSDYELHEMMMIWSESTEPNFSLIILHDWHV